MRSRSFVLIGVLCVRFSSGFGASGFISVQE